MKTVWEFIKKYYKQIIIVLLILFGVFLIIQNSHLRNEAQNNIIVITDSLTTYKNKVNELYDAQTTYVSKISELEDINKKLYDEAKSLKDNPLIITIVETQYKLDTIYIESNKISKDSISNVYSYNWNYSDKDYFHINGESSFDLNNISGKTVINDLVFNSNLTLDVIENNNKLQIIVKSDNPYCNIESIEGAVISPDKIKSISKNVKNKNRWGVGIQAGIGAGLNGQNIIFTPYLGVGISYNIITF